MDVTEMMDAKKMRMVCVRIALRAVNRAHEWDPSWDHVPVLKCLLVASDYCEERSGMEDMESAHSRLARVFDERMEATGGLWGDVVLVALECVVAALACSVLGEDDLARVRAKAADCARRAVAEESPHDRHRREVLADGAFRAELAACDDDFRFISSLLWEYEPAD
jgi:hypothetical protein